MVSDRRWEHKPATSAGYPARITSSSFSTGLSDPEWEIFCLLVHEVRPGGRPEK